MIYVNTLVDPSTAVDERCCGKVDSRCDTGSCQVTGLPLSTGRCEVIHRRARKAQVRVAWLAEVSWPRPDLAEFHLKLIAAAAGLADPLSIVDAQRRELLRDTQRAALAEPDGSAAGLLLEGIVLRLQADLRWLEACERNWAPRKDRS